VSGVAGEGGGCHGRGVHAAAAAVALSFHTRTPRPSQMTPPSPPHARTHARTHRDLYLPTASGGPAAYTSDTPPELTAVESRSSVSYFESWIAVDAAQMAEHPGLYTLRLRGDAGAPTVEVTVVTPSPTTQLAANQQQALAAVAKQCCSAKNSKSQFCSDM